MDELWLQSPHRRWNPLRGEWIVVSPHRTLRPWQGQTEETAVTKLPAFDPACYLCPGNRRAGGALTPRYTGTYVFENDYAALKSDVVSAETDDAGAGLLRAGTEKGICRVLCFHPRHDLTFATMTVEQVEAVVHTWREQFAELASVPWVQYVQIFENRGAMMGASNPHPHGQIWATETIPNEPQAELRTQQAYFAEHGTPLLARYLAMELEKRERVVYENESWVILVPFWGVWPFETIVLPRRAVSAFTELTDAEAHDLADALHRMTAAYDRVFDAPFPYTMGFHAAPVDGSAHPEWVLHAHFYPPLLRSATVRKFMVGFELFGSPQRDITPETAAERLRAVVSLL